METSEKEQIKRLVSKITDTFIEGESLERKELAEKFIRFFKEDITEKERLVITELLFTELSNTEIVKQHIQNETILLKVYQVIGLSLGVGSFLIFLTAMFFSDHFLINSINHWLMDALRVIGFS